MKVKKQTPKNQKIYDRTYALSVFISGCVTLLGILMTLICLKARNTEQMIFCICYAVVFFFVFLFTVLTKKLWLFNLVIKAFLIFMQLFYMKNGGSGGFGLVWLLIIPFLSVYLFDFFNYLALNGIIFLIYVVFLWTPLYQFTYDIGSAFRIRIPLLYFLEILFGIFLRNRIDKTEKDLENQKNILSEEIKNAALIQNAFLAKQPQSYKGWSVGTKNVPMIGVTGDLYCVFDNNHTLNGVGLFDISGHGISSGLLTMLAKNTIEQQFYDNIDANGKEELWETVDKINKQFIEEKGEVQNYLTGILIKISDNELELVNAGQPEPIIYHKKDGTFEYLKKDKNAVGAIGISDFPTLYISQHLKMESGDELFLFTDGLTECVNEKGEEFGTERLVKSFKNHIQESASEQAENIIEDISDFLGKKINDDLTIMILKRN